MTEPAQAEIARLRQEIAARDRRIATLAASQEELLRAVSHDLRAPLRHVTAFGQLVRELLQEEGGAAHAEALGYLGTVDAAARQMGCMIDGLLELSRIARADFVRGPVDTAALVDAVRGALAAAEPARAVVWRIDAALPRVAGDPAWLRVLWTHLLGNAWKFSRAGAPAHIAVAAAPQPDGTVAFEVRDDGAGFEPAQSQRLFGIFQRLHRDAEFEGAGTGLAAARAIVERHGGTIAIDAAPRRGCTVRLTLPLA